jgi:hypothetical protein
MHIYAKAYKLKDLRQFNGWIERKQASDQELTDDSIVFIWDDFSITTGHFDGKQKSSFSYEVTPEWQEFCKNTLHFEIPEDVQKMMEEQQNEQQTLA